MGSLLNVGFGQFNLLVKSMHVFRGLPWLKHWFETTLLLE